MFEKNYSAEKGYVDTVESGRLLSESSKTDFWPQKSSDQEENDTNIFLHALDTGRHSGIQRLMIKTVDTGVVFWQ